MSLEIFLISENVNLREALKKIESNHQGFILTTDDRGSVTGLITDGDIRRKLLDGLTLDDAVLSCVNRDFVWAGNFSSRELLLKQLDQRIKVIPLLDENRLLTGIVSRESLPKLGEEPVYARARSPVRISFGGGGSDLTHFFSGERGAVINTTISLYSHATLRKREDSKVIIHSRDLGATLEASNLSEVLVQKGDFGLLQALLRAIHPNFGFELFLHSDFPINSGLGGSAVVSAAVLGCFNQFRQDRWDSHELAELAFQAERLYLGVAGGWQDQYSTVFGGFNFMEFGMDQNIVHPLRINTEILLELEENLVLCDTGKSHNSGDIHSDQRQHMKNEEIHKKVLENVELTYVMRNHLLRGRLLQFGETLHKAWQLKRQFSSKISNIEIDGIYENALKNGAVGGKLLGAGGGGFFVFYVPPFNRRELIGYLDSAGISVRPFRFEQEGLRAWTARERKNHH
jgi:D-glycero-alpha-D-manno-heptose-7-phosphate kinase